MKKNSKKQSKKKTCAQAKCKQPISIHGFCRLHYIANWRAIKFDKKVKAERRLNAYVDHLAKKYPKSYLDKIRENLSDDDKFRQTMEEINTDDPDAAHETDREYLERFLRTIKGGE